MRLTLEMKDGNTRVVETEESWDFDDLADLLTRNSTDTFGHFTYRVPTGEQTFDRAHILVNMNDVVAIYEYKED